MNVSRVTARQVGRIPTRASINFAGKLRSINLPEAEEIALVKRNCSKFNPTNRIS